jgi:hypothetical protein
MEHSLSWEAIVAELVKKFPAFKVSQKFITLFTSRDRDPEVDGSGTYPLTLFI